MYIILSLLLSSMFAIVVIPNILLVSFKKRLFDTNDWRKIHRGAVPRLGGVAFAPIIIGVVSIITALSVYCESDAIAHSYLENNLKLIIALSSIIMLYLLGLKDDLVGVKFKAKFMVQIVVGAMVFISGLSIKNLHGLLFLHNLPLFLSFLTTILVVVFVINAINLIDGIDGLASSLSVIALIYYGVIFILNSQFVYAIISFATIGTLLPFFYYNLFGSADRCRKIFMGDTGTLTIGFILGLLSIKCANLESCWSGNVISTAFAPLAVPCFDVVRVAFCRLRRGVNPFKPDRSHIHHRLLDCGFSSLQTLFLIILMSLSFMVLIVLFSPFVNVNVLFFVVVALWYVVNFKIDRVLAKNIL